MEFSFQHTAEMKFSFQPKAEMKNIKFNHTARPPIIHLSLSTRPPNSSFSQHHHGDVTKRKSFNEMLWWSLCLVALFVETKIPLFQEFPLFPWTFHHSQKSDGGVSPTNISNLLLNLVTKKIRL
jgi:hypothetical protein